MKKRMMFAVAVLSIGLMATPISAEDVTAGLDLDSMSVEDLVLLRDAVNQKIGEKGGDNILPEGTYEVGVDIKPGHYKAYCCPGYDLANFNVYESKEACQATDNPVQDSVGIDDHDAAMINLEEGEWLTVTWGSAIIEEVNASWAPEE